MINVFKPEITLSDYISVIKTLMISDISGSSQIIYEFENKLSDMFDRKYAISTTNGSSALEIAFKLLNIGEQDEVILPSFTIISCLSAVIRSGATPIFCDVDETSWNMSLENVLKKVTPKTKAVLMVHIYGLTAEAEKISKFCKNNNIFLIEDAAEAHGNLQGSKKCGSFGDISILSFYANKHITTGEGGAILTDNYEYNKKARQMINLDFNPKNRFKHENLYWNYRISGLQAALGLSQMTKINKVIKIKRIQGQYYSTLLLDHKKIITFQPAVWNGDMNNYWVFGILLKIENIRDKVIAILKKNGIETRPFFWPLHLQNALPEKFRNKNEKLKNSEMLGRNGLYLPTGSHISLKKQETIIDVLIKTIENLNE